MPCTQYRNGAEYLKTYNQAQKEVKILLDYIELVEQFEIKNLDDLIIYKYAIHNSISKVIKDIKAHNESFTFNIDSSNVTPEYVKNTILRSPKNQLHSVIKKGYLKKTKPQRNRKNQNI